MGDRRADAEVPRQGSEERFRRVEEIYHAVLERPEAERRDFLLQACAGDDALRHEIDKLLSIDGKAGSFMESPALDVAAQALSRRAVLGRKADFIGQTILHYRMLEKVGEGGMGIVYKALDTHLNRAVAIKVLAPEIVGDRERRLRFVQEARAASALNHPNIITIYDIGQSEGTDFIAMEYVTGKTLAELIPRKGMKLTDALKYSVQIADALAAAHAAGIVHRDLKPANVMITDKGLVKVLDFGLAKLTERAETDASAMTETLEPSTEAGTILGTVAYMSPEQLRGEAVDVRSDIFSFGLVLYEMLTMTHPFQKESPMETASAILHEEPKPASEITKGIPLDLENLINRCLRKDPAKRLLHMDNVKLALEELKQDLDSGRSQVKPAPVKRALPLRLAAVSVTVLALVAAGWYWMRRQHIIEPEAPLTAVPLTSYPGYERSPSFSPDGNYVAFEWCPEGPEPNCDIYIKQIGVDPPERRTSDPARDFSPAWSPDGRFIAFIRKLELKKWSLILVPQRGGVEHPVETWDISDSGDLRWGPYLAWTPDSKWVAFPYTNGIFLASIETGEKRGLTTPLKGTDTAPAFSPDGRALVFSRLASARGDLYLLHLGEEYSPQGGPEKVDTGNNFNFGTAWMPNGQEVVFSSLSVNPGLWKMEVLKPGRPARLAFAPADAESPSISGTGKRLAYVAAGEDINIWRVELGGPGRMPGRPVRFISSTRHDYEPAYSPDGKRIAFVSDRSGFDEVWVCDSQGRNAEQVTSFGNAKQYLQGARWSPDNERIAFFAGAVAGGMNAYVVSTSNRVVRPVTQNTGNNKWPSWSNNGQWLFFNSDSSGQMEIWKVPSAGGEAVQITHTKKGTDGQELPDVPQESPDGRFIYYCKGWPFPQGVWRIPVEGGEEVKVLDSGVSAARFAVTQEGIYYFAWPDTEGRATLFLYEFAGGKPREILESERRLAGAGSVGISPNGRTILYTQRDQSGSDLMLVENFR